MLIKGGVTLITRGYGQTVTLEPYLYAEDPDYPSMQVTVAMVMVGISEVNRTFPVRGDAVPLVLSAAHRDTAPGPGEPGLISVRGQVSPLLRLILLWCLVLTYPGI